MAIKVIKVGEDILGANEEKARTNKQKLDKNRVFTINIMSFLHNASIILCFFFILYIVCQGKKLHYMWYKPCFLLGFVVIRGKF